MYRICTLLILCNAVLCHASQFLGPPVRFFEAKVKKMEFVSRWMKEITFEYPEKSHLHLFPGAYLRVHVPPYVVNTAEWEDSVPERFRAKWYEMGLFNQIVDYSNIGSDVSRPYSITNFSSRDHDIRLLVKIVKPNTVLKGWGMASSYLFSLRPGDMARFSGTFGHYPVLQREKPLIFIIGGCGIAPAKSLIDYYLLEMKSEAPILLFYSASELDEAVFHEHFLELLEEHDNFYFQRYLTHETGEYDCECIQSGDMIEMLADQLIEQIDDIQEGIFHVCGTKDSSQKVIDVLKGLDVDEKRIIMDS